MKTSYYRKMYTLLVISAVFTTCSCKDSKTAKDIEGTVNEPEKKENKTDSEPIKLTVKNVEYWDNLAKQGENTYVPANMVDGNPKTAWAVNLDNASYDSDMLYGPVFTLNCRKLSYIVIQNGYAKSQEAFRNNARASRIIICNADKMSDENEAASYLYEGMLEDSPERQTLRIAPDLTCNRDVCKVQLVFPVDGLREGNKWNDLCVSEIEFYGYE